MDSCIYDYYTSIFECIIIVKSFVQFFSLLFSHCFSIIDRLVVYFYQTEKTHVHTYTGSSRYFCVCLFCSPWLVTQDIDIWVFRLYLSFYIYKLMAFNVSFFFPLFFSPVIFTYAPLISFIVHRSTVNYY